MTETKDNVCIYHHNCADGFTSAWVVWKQFPEWEFYPGVHGEEPPHYKNKNIYIVDFSYKRPVLDRLLEDGNNIILLDHHKSAIPEAQDLLDSGKISGVLDMDRSGAMITWDWFNPGKEAPRFIKYVQDRDLWRFELDETAEIQSYIFMHEYDFIIWNKMVEDLEDDKLFDIAYQKGCALAQKQTKDILEFMEQAEYRMNIGGHNVPVLNVPYFWSSEAGHIMAQNEPFAACYWDQGEDRIFSLRSKENGVDVSEIARQYGGGGHRNAAGFRTKSRWYGE